VIEASLDAMRKSGATIVVPLISSRPAEVRAQQGLAHRVSGLRIAPGFN
jgi:hypothetical protein